MKNNLKTSNMLNKNTISTNISLILENIKNKDDDYNQFILDNEIDHIFIKDRLIKFFNNRNNKIPINKNSIELINILQQIFGENDKCSKFIYTFNIQHGIGGDESIYFLNDFIEMHNDAIKTIFMLNKNIIKNKIIPSQDYYIEINLNDIDFNLLTSIIMLMQEGPTIRVQRQPVNSTQMHTSTIIFNTNFINLNKSKNEIKNSLLQDKFFIWETFKASGAGGQHVNKTSSAVRLKHKILKDVNIVSQQERNQIQNKKIALKKLEEEIEFYVIKLINDVLNYKSCNTNRNYKNTTYNYRRNQITHEDGYQFSFDIIKDSYRLISFKRAIGLKK